jgi:hypothetical protein
MVCEEEVDWIQLIQVTVLWRALFKAETRDHIKREVVS